MMLRRFTSAGQDHTQDGSMKEQPAVAAGYVQQRPNVQNTRRAAEREKRRRTRLIWGIIGAVVVVGIGILVIAGVSFKATGIEPTHVSITPVSGSPTYADINTNPAAYFGRTVTITSTVTQIVTNRAYVVGGFGHGEPILVLDAAAQPHQVTYGQTVTVHGTYQELQLKQIEQKTGVHFDQRALYYYDLRPTIVTGSGS